MTPLGILRKPAIMVSTAVRDATSPRSCPPTPSASAKSQPCDCTCAGERGKHMADEVLVVVAGHARVG